MRKIIPIIILLVGVGVAIGAFLFIKSTKSSKDTTSESEAEESLPEIAFDERPVVSLTPSDDGHWLTLGISKIVINAATMDYEVTYKLPDGRTQGVPGTAKIEKGKDIEKELLLGSESSGKFRYDEGVETGNILLRFRDDKGKLVAKFETEFTLGVISEEMSSPDGRFTYKVDESGKLPSGYYVILNTVGVPFVGGYELKEGDRGPYGVYSSLAKGLKGEVSFDLNVGYFRFDGEDWEDVRNSPSPDFGIFIALGE